MTMWIDILIQAIGFLALAINIIAVQFNKYGTIILLKTIGSLLFVVQYIFLHAYTGMIMDIIGSIRNVIFSFNVKNNRSNKVPVIIFSVLTAVLGTATIIMTWDVSKIVWTDDLKLATLVMVLISILSIIAKLISTISYSLKDPHKMRILNFPSASCWLVYNFITFSIAGFISEIMTMCSIVIAELRFRKTKKILN